MRVLVCGSRTFTDESIVTRVLHGFWDSTLTVIEGGAKGADALAAFWAQTRPDGVGHEQYPADWATHGKAAGPRRNQLMLDEGKPDIVLAFVDKPLVESKGTADMVRRARMAGVTTYVMEAHDA